MSAKNCAKCLIFVTGSDAVVGQTKCFELNLNNIDPYCFPLDQLAGYFNTLNTTTMENEILKCSNLDNLINNQYDLGDLVSLMNGCLENNQKFLQAFLNNIAINEVGIDKLFNVLDCANITAKQKSNSKKYLREFSSKIQTNGK